MIEFVWPQTTGEWLAWPSAVVMLLHGLWMFVAPRWWLSFMKLQPHDVHPHAIALMRGAMGGANMGLGFSVLLLHPQPLLYLALGAMYFFAAVARLISIFLDNGHSKYNWTAFTAAGILAFGPLAYALGYIA